MIVNLFDRVSTAIEYRKNQLNQLEKIFNSLFIEMFGNVKINPLNFKIGIIRDVVLDVKYGTSKPANEGGKYKYLRMGNITYDGYLDLSDLKYIDISDNEIDKYLVKNGDVLFNRTNSRELVGKTCVFDLEESMIIAGYIIRVRLKKLMLPIYLSMFLNSDYGKKILYDMCKAIVGQANINAQELQNIEILIPPITIQNKFADRVKQIDKSKVILKSIIKKLEIIKKSLSKIFSKNGEFVPLKNLIAFHDRSKINASEGKSEGKYPFFTASQNQSKWIDKNLFNGPSLIFGAGGKASIHYYEEEFSTAATCLVAYPKQNNVDLKYIYFYLSQHLHLIETGFRGTAIKQISKEYILDIKIPILSNKQERTITIFNILDKLKNIRKEQQKKFDLTSKSLFIEMLKEKKSDDSLDKLVVYLSRGRTSKYVESSNIIVINQACIYWDGINFNKVKYYDENKIANFNFVSDGDLLINSTGTGTLGRCNVFYAPDDKKYIVDTHVTIIRLDYSKIKSIVLKEYFSLPEVQNELYRTCVNGSTNQIELSKEKFLKFKIPLIPINFQNEFADKVKQIDKSKFRIKQILDRLDILYKVLTERCFKIEETKEMRKVKKEFKQLSLFEVS